MPSNQSWEISNCDDVIDSRAVNERVAELESERDAFELPEGTWPEGWTAAQEWAEQYPDEAAELRALTDLASEAEGYAPDWQYGAALIRDSYFQDYAQELADDIGAVPDNVTWPLTCIDWEQAARELRMDYTSVEFDGVTYWVR